MTSSVILPNKNVIRTVYRRQQETFGGTEMDPDESRLGAALAWPRLMVSSEGGSDIFEVTVSLLTGLLGEKPFPENNRRTAFTLAVLTLRRNDWILDISNDEALRLMMALSMNNITEEKAIDFLRRKSVPETG